MCGMLAESCPIGRFRGDMERWRILPRYVSVCKRDLGVAELEMGAGDRPRADAKVVAKTPLGVFEAEDGREGDVCRRNVSALPFPS